MWEVRQINQDMGNSHRLCRLKNMFALLPAGVSGRLPSFPNKKQHFFDISNVWLIPQLTKLCGKNRLRYDSWRYRNMSQVILRPYVWQNMKYAVTYLIIVKTCSWCVVLSQYQILCLSVALGSFLQSYDELIIGLKAHLMWTPHNDRFIYDICF